jgi:hypothetical protein
MTTTSNDHRWRPVFGTGLARSGGGLYSTLLSVHEQIDVALCPHLELFRSFRNAVVRSMDDPDALAAVPPSAPMQDHYFTDTRIAVFDAILDADLDLPFEDAEWEVFLERSIARANLETAELTPLYPKLRGRTYRDIFDNALGIIGEHRASRPGTVVGWHEPWAIDFFPALARAYPEARFLVMLRDIRAVVSSVRGVGDRIPEQFVQALSYVRHWRKYVALAMRYSEDPLFAGRIHVTSHDDMVTRPEESVRAICAFLGVDFDPRMLDTEEFVDQSTGGRWAGNSSFEESTQGIKAVRATRWREKLDEPSVAALEWLCGPELEIAGWELLGGPWSPHPSAEALQILLDESTRYSNWRSDLGDPLLDIGAELLRSSLLRAPGTLDDALVRRCFLFRETYDALRAGGTRLRRT